MKNQAALDYLQHLEQHFLKDKGIWKGDTQLASITVSDMLLMLQNLKKMVS